VIVTCIKCNRHVDTGETPPGEVIRCACGTGILVPEGPAAAGKMNCPACGAPVDPEKARCTYCDTRLATVICPACFGTIFDTVKHCPHCGEALQGRELIHHGDETKHLCPRCAEHPPLRVEVVTGYPLERCISCEGLWVDRETAERLYKSKEKTGEVERVVGQQQVKSQVVKGTAEGYIKCVVCGTMMNRKNFGRYSGVIIDVCQQHGTWFDAGELQRIMQFIGTGGLLKAANREKMRLEEEIRSLQSQRSSAGSGSIGGFDSGSLMADPFLKQRGALAIVGRLLRGLFFD
jgi:Zn-finger nucleic acid-binding protein